MTQSTITNQADIGKAGGEHEKSLLHVCLEHLSGENSQAHDLDASEGQIKYLQMIGGEKLVAEPRITRPLLEAGIRDIMDGKELVADAGYDCFRKIDGDELRLTVLPKGRGFGGSGVLTLSIRVLKRA